jgi:hypothetical protein
MGEQVSSETHTKWGYSDSKTTPSFSGSITSTGSVTKVLRQAQLPLFDWRSTETSA